MERPDQYFSYRFGHHPAANAGTTTIAGVVLGSTDNSSHPSNRLMWSANRGAVVPVHHEDDPGGVECFDRLRHGDPDALNELLEVYWHPLVSYVRHRTVDATDAAEDLVQEAFVRLWERRASWREGSLPAPVLYTIVRNLAINDSRNRNTRQLSLRLFGLRSNASRTPEDELEHRELSAALDAAIAALPPRRREIFILARFHDLSHAEIAELMFLTPQTVANQMSSALSTLRVSLRSFLREAERVS
jgi:RNA polymerase sigma-70 factor, ECF subfamily